MRVAVIGAGVVGVATAYELAADGHEVVVFERRGSVAVESSFALAGLASPGAVGPWAGPGHPGRWWRTVLERQHPWHLTASPRAWRWLWRWSRAGQPDQLQRMHRLAAYSRERLHGLAAALRLDYERSDGHVVLARTAAELDRLRPAAAQLAAQGIPAAVVDDARCRAIEPGLNADTALAGGVHLPADEVGNGRQFALLLRGEAERLGALFRFHTAVSRIAPGPRPRLTVVHAPHEETTSLMTPHGEAPEFEPTQPLDEPMDEAVDAVVVCAAVDSADLLAPLGLRLPLAGVSGHSVTLPIRHHEAHPDIGPRSAITDSRHQVVIHRLGNRLRVAGGAAFGAAAKTRRQEDVQRLYRVLDDWFPGAARLSQAQRWTGTRPMLPDGPPLVGPSGIAGVFLNLGHGGAGWAMACGAARLAADQVGGRTPGVDPEGLGIERYAR